MKLQKWQSVDCFTEMKSKCKHVWRTIMKRSSYFIGMILIVVLLLWGTIAVEKTHAQSSAIKITDVVPATAQTGVIFQTSLTINYSAGRMILAGDEQGTGRMFVDDG